MKRKCKGQCNSKVNAIGINSIFLMPFDFNANEKDNKQWYPFPKLDGTNKVVNTITIKLKI